MICWHCHHLIDTKNMTLTPNAYGFTVGNDTKVVREGTVCSIFDTKCRHCGSEYRFEVTQTKPCVLTIDQLKAKLNTISK